jgi:diaminopimelate epimerase
MRCILKIKFTKMTAGGNDFIIIDHRGKNTAFDIPAFARLTCRRKFGIGADGVLLLESSPSADVNLRIFNSDGSEAEMCGNGACCTALYINSIGRLAGGDDKKVTISTKAGILKAVILDKNRVKLKMTTPKDIRFDFTTKLGGITHRLYFVNTGVPHTVIFVEDLKNIPVDKWGRKIRHLKDFFPDGTNVDFVKVKSDKSLGLRVYERGVEKETFSCGTGAVAAAVVATKTEKVIKSPVSVYPYRGNRLKVHLRLVNKEITDVYLENEAQVSYIGEVKWQS